MSDLSAEKDAGLAAAKEAVEKAKADYEAALTGVRADCEHPVLLEAPWEDSMFFDPLRPLRICERCGLEEEGWTFYVLTGRAYPATRTEVYRCRKGEGLNRVTEEQKTAAARGRRSRVTSPDKKEL